MKSLCIETAAIMLLVCDSVALAQADTVESPNKATQREHWHR
jgi:hypothetical protein